MQDYLDQGSPLIISFQGVESGFALWCNGQYVGYSEDSFTPSEFDLTAFVRPGLNKLAVRVFKWTASSWLESQDFFRFSGIYRSVYLCALPETALLLIAPVGVRLGVLPQTALLPVAPVGVRLGILPETARGVFSGGYPDGRFFRGGGIPVGTAGLRLVRTGKVGGIVEFIVFHISLPFFGKGVVFLNPE